MSTFLPYTQKAVSVTTNGSLVLWDLPIDHENKTKGRAAIKALKAKNHSTRLNLVRVTQKLIVVGGEDGSVSFFDFNLKSIGWFDDIKSGGVHAVSFDKDHSENKATSSSSEEVFDCPDFFVSTKGGKIVHMEAKMFRNVHAEKRRGHPLVDGFDARLACVACHPSDPDLFATGTSSGVLKLWNLRTTSTLQTMSFDAAVTAAAFHPDGKSLVVGVGNGKLQFLQLKYPETNTTSEKDLKHQPDNQAHGQNSQLSLIRDREIKELTNSITRIRYSPCGGYIATADVGRHVGLFRWYHRDERKNKPIEWIYVGRHRAHKNAVVSVEFLPSNWEAKAGQSTGSLYKSRVTESQSGEDGGAPRLFSLGEDRLLNEFDIGKSGINQGLVLKSSSKTDESAVPTSLLPIGGALSRVVCASDGYQLKLFAERKRLNLPLSTLNGASNENGGESNSVASNAADAYACVRTTLAPTYGGPVNDLKLLSKVRKDGKTLEDSKYVFYSTYAKIVGLLRLPLDGDPIKSSALLAHSGEISSTGCTCDGRYVITAGGPDTSLVAWQVSTSALDAGIVMGGDPNLAFANLLDGGAGGENFKEVKDYFYLCQLREQGLETTDARKVSGVIPPRQVVNLFQALGFYPTKWEIQNLEQELHTSSDILKNQDNVPQVDFQGALRLFLNHRPVYGLKRSGLEEALTKIVGTGGERAIKREELINVLKMYGEKMSTDEITNCLAILQGASPDSDLSQLLGEFPGMMDADDIATELLCLQPRQ